MYSPTAPVQFTFRVGLSAVVFSTIIVCLSTFAHAQTTGSKASKPLYQYPSIGLSGGLNFNFHNPAFTTLINAPSTFTGSGQPQFASALGLGAAVGLSFNHPVSENITVGARLGYNNLSGSMNAQQVSFQAGGNRATVDQKLDASLATIEFTPNVSFYNVLPIENLYLLGGIEIGFHATNNDNRTTTIGVNANSPTANTVATQLNDAATRFALAAGVGYMMEVAKNVTLQPELSIRFPFTQVTSSTAYDSWTIPQVRFGINLMYHIMPLESKQTSEADPNLQVNNPRIVYYSPEGDTTDAKNVKVEDIQYSELYPLIPYIFFAQNSTATNPNLKIPNKGQAGESTDMIKSSDAIDVNNTILNIVCARMKKYETATLTIIGTNDGKGEARKASLSKERADKIRDYLVGCGISADRLKVLARDLPEKASASSVADGIEENRRVELRSDMPEILEPVTSQLEVERIADPDLLEFLPSVVSSDTITSWRLEITQAGQTLREYTGSGTPKSLRWAIRPSELSDKQVPIDYTYVVENARGDKKTVNGSVPVEYISSLRKRQERLADRTINKFSLILFDFDKDNLTEDNQRILEKKVMGAIKPNSIVKVYGYSDRIGDDKYNRQLSLRRAQTIAETLRSKYKDTRFEIYGIGETKEIYDNDLPVGRQLSRTVQIYVETPR